MPKVSWGAGHGYNTSGKRAPDGSMREWEFNSAVVKLGMELLNDYENVSQLRVDDPTGVRDVPLTERTNRVNAWGSNLHISVHANAFGDGVTFNNVKGMETFVYNLHSVNSLRFANIFHPRFIARSGMVDRKVKTANFHILRETNMAAVLPEFGFMTNREDLALLKSNSFRRMCAEVLVESIAIYFNLKKKNVSPPSTPPKEEIKLNQKIVVINSFADYPVAELLMNYIGAPIVSKKLAVAEKKGIEAFVVGGNADGVKADKITLLSGPDRYATARAVEKYIKG